MRPKHLKQFLVRAIAARIPILITSEPGVGKSSIIEQAAAEAGAQLLISHPAVADPTDFKGLPWMQPGKKSADFVPFADFATALAATEPMVWLFDDLGQAPATVQAAAMQLFLARRVNGHVLPDCVTFLAATNRRTDRAGVTGILEPVKSRFVSIVPLEANINDWSDWAFAAGMPAELIAFLRFRYDLLCKFAPTADLTNCPLPRTWSHVGKLLAMNATGPALPDSVMAAAISGAVGEGGAVEFMAFRRLWAQLPSIDAILLDPNASAIPSGKDAPATLYAIVTALGMRVNVQNFGRIARYTERLVDATHGEFAALLLRDCINRDPGVQNTAAFIKLAHGALGDLISGEIGATT